MSTQQTFDENARNYEKRFMDFSLYDDTYDALSKLLPQHANVLDVGCGPANVSCYLKNKRPDLKIHGIDFAPRMIELARKNIPDGTFEIRDIRKISEITQRFDAIVCGFCLPYLSQEELEILIRDCKEKLQPAGIFYLSWIEGAYESSGSEYSSDGKHGAHVYRYEKDYISSVCQKNAFTPIHSFGKQYSKSDNLLEIHSILIVKK